MGRVLLVEDDAVLAELIREYLESVGHTVVAALDGADGLSHALLEDFDVLICDLMLPKVAGEDLCDELTKQRPEMRDRILIVTGDILSEQVAAFLERTGLPCIQKPFGLKELATTLGGLFGDDKGPTTTQ